MFCHALFCHDLFCSVMICSIMHCSVMLCHARRRRGGRETRGTLGAFGDLAAASCRVAGSGGLFLKPNDPNLPGGWVTRPICSVMFCSGTLCDGLSYSVLICSVLSFYGLPCFVMLVEGTAGGTIGGFSVGLGIWRPRYAGWEGRRSVLEI